MSTDCVPSGRPDALMSPLGVEPSGIWHFSCFMLCGNPSRIILCVYTIFGDLVGNVGLVGNALSLPLRQRSMWLLILQSLLSHPAGMDEVFRPRRSSVCKIKDLAIMASNIDESPPCLGTCCNIF